MTTVQAEFERLSRIFDRIGYPLKTAPPASESQINSIAATTGELVCRDKCPLGADGKTAEADEELPAYCRGKK